MGFLSTLNGLIKDQDQMNGSQPLKGAARDADAVGMFSASTSPTISGLSGAAMTNSSLAALGGGALSAGGLGMAGGTATVTATGASIKSSSLSLSKEDQLMLIGSRVRISRILLKMSQDACATSAGISRTALRNLEEGNDTKMSTLFAVSIAIGIPLKSWFEED